MSGGMKCAHRKEGVGELLKYKRQWLMGSRLGSRISMFFSIANEGLVSLFKILLQFSELNNPTYYSFSRMIQQT